jgi:hypothetical protein
VFAAETLPLPGEEFGIGCAAPGFF